MQLEDSVGARSVALLMQLQFLCLRILRLQRTVAQEVNAVREAQLPALNVSFKVHHKGLMREKQAGRERDRNVMTHTEST